MLTPRSLLPVSLAAVLALPAALPLKAQTPNVGRIVGRIVNATTGEPIAGAQITILGTSIAVVTVWTGQFDLTGVPVGRWSISVRAIGYTPKTVSDVDVQPDSALALDVSLGAAVVQLEGVTVTAAQERGSVSAALDQQRTSGQIVNAVTAEQMAHSPDGDAGEAVKRVSGVTVQDGKYVFVRGLGERYTTTSLNNARIPSPEPDRKVVPFDLFPSNLLESITTAKTFTPDQPGDFSGAAVNLRTRDFPLHRHASISLAGGGNTAATGREVALAPTVGSEWLGQAGPERRLPAPAQAIERPADLATMSPAQVNAVIGAFRNAWSARTRTGREAGSLGLSIGGNADAGRMPLGYLAAFTYSTTQDVRRDERRSLAVSGSGPGLTRPQNAYFGGTATASVLWGGLLNLSTRLGPRITLSSQNTFSLSADNQAVHLAGANEEFASDFDVTRLTFTQRMMRSNQLSGQVQLAEQHHLDWSVTASGVRRYEPDRSDLVFTTSLDTSRAVSVPIAWWGGPRSAVRTFSDLHESGLEVAGNYRLTFGPAARPHAVKVGVDYRTVHRTSDSRSFDIINNDLSDAERSQPAETIFNGAYAAAGRLLLFLDANGGNYAATDRQAAGYGQLELSLGERLRLIGGARVEAAQLDVRSVTAQGLTASPRLHNVDVLPALALTLRVTGKQNLRLAASQTLSRPEYRELSPVPYADVLGGLTVFGNPGLRRALIQNVDARWEWYPGPAEVVSVAVFVKRFDHPIEKVIVAQTGASALSFVNAQGASNLGVELEMRRNLSFFSPSLLPFTAFVNATLMRSRIRPGNDSIASNTNANRPMMGQAGYVVNAGLTYATPNGRLSATALYNVVGRRIVEVGQQPLPDAYELPRHVVDATVQAQLASRVAVKLDTKNLLDAPYRVVQGSVTRLRYRAGRAFTLGVTLTP
jgi:outer membrane receptor for ferrienterochelin and colicin